VKLFAFVLMCSVAFSLAGQTAATVPITVLHGSAPSEIKPVSAFLWYDFPKGDDAGNLYFHPDPPEFDTPVLIKLPAGTDDDAVVYKVPDKGDDSCEYRAFSVTRAGSVAMIADCKEGTTIIHFLSDGSVSSRTPLDIAKGFDPSRVFAVFDSGVSIVGGSFNRTAPKPLWGTSLFGVFSPSGKLLRRLNDWDNIDKSANPKFYEGYATFGSDGLLYILQPNEKIVVMSEAGEIVRTITYRKPVHDAIASHLVVSGNLGVVELHIVSDPTKLSRILLVVIDLTTGETFRVYEADSELGRGMVNFSSKDGFTFLRVSKGRLQRMTAPLR